MKKLFCLLGLILFAFWGWVSISAGPALSQGPKESRQDPVLGFLRDLILYSQIQGVKVELRGDGLATGFRSFSLAQPLRLVFDFPGLLSSFPKKFIEVEHPLLKHIRFGQHPDKLRMVLTFSSAEIPPYRIERAEGALAIIIGKMEKPVVEEGGKSGETEKPKAEESRPPREKASPAPPPTPAAVPAGEKDPPAPAEKSEPEKPPVRMEPAQRITLDLANADIRDVFSQIAEAAKRQIVAGPEVQGSLTLRLVDVPWDQALDAILSIYNLRRVDEGSLIRILPRGKS